MSDRQKVFCALVASALFHVVVVAVLWLGSRLHAHETAPALPDLSHLEVTIMPKAPQAQAPPPLAAATPVPTPTPAPLPRPLPKTHVLEDIDSSGLTASKQAPEHADFQSDVNMQAGSELPARGNRPLPTLDGKSMKFEQFKTQSSSFGNGEVASQAKPSRAHQAAPEPAAERTPAAVTKVMPAPRPPVPRATPELQPTPALAQATPAPTAAPEPIATPTPAASPEALAATTPTPTPAPARPRPSIALASDGLALGQPTPRAEASTAKPTPVQLAKLNTRPLMRGAAEIEPLQPRLAAPREREEPQPGNPEPGMQEEMLQTRVDGGITRHGRPGVDAVDTPYGRYTKLISRKIGARWDMYVKSHPDLSAIGDVTIDFKIDQNGKVRDTRVKEDHAKGGLAAITIRAIVDCDLPPIPDSLAPTLTDGKMEMSYTFNVYDPN